MKNISLFALILCLFASSLASAADDDLEYFKQFLFSEKNISSDPDFPEYQYQLVVTEWNDLVPVAGGNFVRPRVELKLFENGQFEMLYMEFVQEENADHFYPKGCKIILGTWSVPEDKLLLEGIGYAERNFLNGQHALKLTYTEKLISTEVIGHSVNATYGFTQDPNLKCMGPF